MNDPTLRDSDAPPPDAPSRASSRAPSSVPSNATASSHPGSLAAHIAQRIAQAGGWLAFDEFMALALYAPQGGYYARGSAIFGKMPGGQGSDFVTAPEMSPLFGQTLARQVAEALAQTQTTEVWEFGAGTGALAFELLQTIKIASKPHEQRLTRYHIVDVSGGLRAAQQARLAEFGPLVQWHDQLPAQFSGVVIGNEVLDAMPVKLLQRTVGQWFERGVALAQPTPATARPELAQGPLEFAWADRPTTLRPPLEVEGEHDYLTEIHPQAQAFVRTLADKLRQGAAFLIDYGFPEAEYYHPQRHMGTLMCHENHRADPNPLLNVGGRDITAHVDFTGIALAGQDAGLAVLGYCSQARFLINCGMGPLLDAAPLAVRANAQRLIMEHEMGELFKVIGFCKGPVCNAMGFAQGDRCHTL